MARVVVWRFLPGLHWVITDVLENGALDGSAAERDEELAHVRAYLGDYHLASAPALHELANALALLNPRMRLVISRRFGLDGQAPRTLEQVGSELGITRERVRQLESRALRELRSQAPELYLYLRTA